jgi:DNA-binding NtrC family response regulator
MTQPTLLIVHEGTSALPDVMRAVKDGAWRIETVAAKDARQALVRSAPHCVLVAFADGTLRMQETVLEELTAYDDNLPFIAVARKAKLEDAVALMKAGAYDYFACPLNHVRLKHVVTNAIRLYGLTKKVFLLESSMGWRMGLEDMVGQSAGMQEVYQSVQMVAKSNATVLILGESGTGKELVARAIHRLSARGAHKMIDINCGAIPRELLENELFGHERGSFTGADRRYQGSCEVANGSTLFLDEISEMDPSLQVKMLRFLQERNFTRVGGNENISVDVRVIAATNRDLEKEVAEGRFREDLFYRLNVVPIRVPPLRERREDVPLLAKHFLEKYSTKYERMFIDIAAQAGEGLVAHDWPGNVRELENVMERVVVLNNDTRVKLAHLPPPLQQVKRSAGRETVAKAAPNPNPDQIVPLKLVEKYAIESALTRCMGNVLETSKKLKVSQATLYRKIKQYGLKV